MFIVIRVTHNSNHNIYKLLNFTQKKEARKETISPRHPADCIPNLKCDISQSVKP